MIGPASICSSCSARAAGREQSRLGRCGLVQHAMSARLRFADGLTLPPETVIQTFAATWKEKAR
jgi:hypothetical protein